MEDSKSFSSLDSTNEEYVLVSPDPKLRIPNNGNPNDLEKKLSEVLSDDSNSNQATMADSEGESGKMAESCDTVTSGEGVGDMMEDGSGETVKPVTTTEGTENTEQDQETSTSLPNSPENECTLFDGVTYLGSASVNAPRSEREINRNMEILNEHSQMAIPVTLAVPTTSEGIVRLLEPNSDVEIASYRIHRILFCARGNVETPQQKCFAYTCSHGDSAETAIFQCHVFRCDLQDAVGKILYCFATSFRRAPRRLNSCTSIMSLSEDSVYKFDVSLEIAEDDGKGNYSTCPKDKTVFKLRQRIEKKVTVSVLQTSNKDLKIERCFGMLICPGRNVKHSDMHLIDMVSMGSDNGGLGYTIAGEWNPNDNNFSVLNSETPKDTRVFMTVAVDLVIDGIHEPVRFCIETKARIFPQNERFWYFSKKPYHEMFYMKLKEVESSNGDSVFEVMSLKSQTEIDRQKSGMTLTLSPTKNVTTPQDIQTPIGLVPEDESDTDEPLMSGSGTVTKEITDEELLASWTDVILKWQQALGQRPKAATQLIRKGIPEPLRGEVWQLLCGCHDSKELFEAYRILITKDSPCEQVILRDINRTFPAHDYFKETGGVGQDVLFKISKAYSLYDEEVGYCQGLSFLAAALVLHMPEEQAFAVLVKLMFDYGLRHFFKDGFEELHMRFYQLERLQQDLLPDLFSHFMELQLEAHMYASQWFLTLFTAKFPLSLVYHIIDIFMCEGLEVIFHVAIALLKTSRKDLLALDFEGALKYFRVHLPKKYRTEDHARELIDVALKTKVSHKKLKKYEKEFIAMKEAELQQEDPIERFERENKRLLDANMRLEQENDDLAHELVTAKITLRNDLDNAEDNVDVLDKDLQQARTQISELEEEKKRLTEESAGLKEMCRREIDRTEGEITRLNAITAEYKQICTQLSERLEKQSASYKDDIHKMKTQMKSCDSCSKFIAENGELVSSQSSGSNSDVPSDPDLTSAQAHIRELELELAQTKLALVESQCKTQDLTHQLHGAENEIEASKNTWFSKTFSTIKEATTKNATRKKSETSDSKEPSV